jgi:hypothetical protein
MLTEKSLLALALRSIKANFDQEKSVKPIESDEAMLSSDDPKAQWQKPEVAKLVTRGAEGGDNFSGEGGGGFS